MQEKKVLHRLTKRDKASARVLFFMWIYPTTMIGIDMLIRRIPNALLLGMLLLQICNMVITSNGLDVFMDTFFNSFIGMIVAYVLFVIPGLFKLRIGAGDVKYSAVIGFMLGLQGYVEAMAVMGFTIFIYYYYY